MLKDKTKYASTGGWGFQAWAGGDPTKPLVTDPPNNASNVTSRRRTRITCIQPTSRKRSMNWLVRFWHRRLGCVRATCARQ